MDKKDALEYIQKYYIDDCIRDEDGNDIWIHLDLRRVIGVTYIDEDITIMSDGGIHVIPNLSFNDASMIINRWRYMYCSIGRSDTEYELIEYYTEGNCEKPDTPETDDVGIL
jgi:hypothetical protein